MNSRFESAHPELAPSSITRQMPVAADATEITVVRDEIFRCDRLLLCGYRFRAVAQESHRIDARAIAAALQADNLGTFAQRRMAVVPIRDKDWLAADFRQFAMPNLVFLVAAPAPDGDMEHWCAVVRQMKNSGARIGLDSALAAAGLADGLADIAFVRSGDYTDEGLEHHLRELRMTCGANHIAVEDVHSWDEYRHCLALGVDYCLGHFPDS